MLLTRVLGSIIALLVVIIVILGIFLKFERDSAALAKANLSTCMLANSGWEERAKENNDRLIKIMQENEALNERAKKALAAAKINSDKSRQLSEQLKAVKAAPQDCKAATDLINRYLSERSAP